MFICVFVCMSRYMELYQKEEMFDKDWMSNELCVLMKKRQQSVMKSTTSNETNSPLEFFRGKIVKRSPVTQKYTILLLDAGIYEENVDEKFILKLVDEYNNKPEFKAKWCSVAGVEPMGMSNGQWSSRAKKYTADTLNGQHVHVVFDWNKKRDENQAFEVT